MKKRTKILTLLTTIMLVSGIGATLTSCQDDSAPQNGTLQKTISLSTAFLELNEGETNKLTLDGLKGGETITYLSLNPAVASISADGTVTGLSYGDTIVEVTVGEYTYTCSVRVNAPLTGVLTGYVNVDGSQNGKLNMLPNDEYELNVTAVKGAQPLADGTYTVEWKTDGDGFALTVDETDGSQVTIKANAFGAVQVWAEITYLGETVSTDPLSVVSQEIYLLDNGFVNNTITLVGETTVAGNPATKCNTTELNLTYETVVTGETGTIDAKNMDWKVLDETVATIDENGVLKARAEGATKIVGEHEIYGEISMTVDVWNGIEKPEDLDALALITYYNDEEIATKLLSRRYLLTDDIDYSTHVRNFILPIASPAGGLYHYYKTTEGVTDCWDLANGNFTWAAMNTVNVTAHAATAVAHYSLTWKNLLGLTDATETIDGTTVHYLKDADGNEFKGVNPYLVPFTGTLNGNGYSVKNAWLMADNFVFKIPNKDGEINTIGAAACFMGINKGTVTNIGFESINIPNRNVTYKLTKSDGLNTEMQYLKYWHNASESSGTFNGAYGGLTSGSYVKTNDGGSTLLNWRWNGDALRSFGSSLIISNLGKIENVYMDYVSCSSSIASGVGATNFMAWSGRARADGLVFVNAAEISNCLVVRHDPTSDQFSSSFTLSANYYATNYLVAYDCNSKYGHTPTISNVGAYNDTAATNFNASSASQIDTDKVKTPLHFTNPADGSGITALTTLPSVSNNDYVTLIRIA